MEVSVLVTKELYFKSHVGTNYEAWDLTGLLSLDQYKSHDPKELCYWEKLYSKGKKYPSLAIRKFSVTGTWVEIKVKHNSSGLFWEIKTPSSSSCNLGIQIEAEIANWEINIKVGPCLGYSRIFCGRLCRIIVKLDHIIHIIQKSTQKWQKIANNKQEE